MAVVPVETTPALYNPELIKPDLAFDGENYKLNKRELSKIKATHGATIEAAASLLLTGEFQKSNTIAVPRRSRGVYSFDKEFYTTPNPRYGFDIDALDGEFDAAEFADIDAVMAGIEYAGNVYEGDEYAGNVEDLHKNGVVIAFSGKLSLEGAEIWVDPMSYHNAEASNGIELVLPETPPIDTVHGIYPVDDEALRELNKALQG